MSFQYRLFFRGSWGAWAKALCCPIHENGGRFQCSGPQHRKATGRCAILRANRKFQEFLSSASQSKEEELRKIAAVRQVVRLKAEHIPSYKVEKGIIWLTPLRRNRKGTNNFQELPPCLSFDGKSLVTACDIEKTAKPSLRNDSYL